MNNYLKFSCIYCGQRLECGSTLAGRQILCPTCLHRITIPLPGGCQSNRWKSLVGDTWDSHIPLPQIEIPARYRTPVLAHSV